MDAPRTMSGGEEAALRGADARVAARPAGVSIVPEETGDDAARQRGRRRTPQAGLAGGPVVSWTAAMIVALVLGGATWLQVPAEYELRCRLTCAPALPEIPIDFKAMLRELQAPPGAGDTSAHAGWAFGQLLAEGRVNLAVSEVDRVIDITCRTRDVERGDTLLTLWLDGFLESVSRPAAVGQELDALVASFDTGRPVATGAPAEYGQALRTLRELHGRMYGFRQALGRLVRELDEAQARPAPAGVVQPAQREETFAGDVTLTQDMRQVRFRMTQLCRLYLGCMRAAVDSLAGAASGERILTGELAQLREGASDMAIDHSVEIVRQMLTEYSASRAELTDSLAGLLAGLGQLEDEAAQDLLDIVDRSQTLARIWMDRSAESLARAQQMADGMLEGREPSARRVVVQNHLQRGLRPLQQTHESARREVARLRGDRTVQVDALSQTIRGLSVRAELRRRELEAELQRLADEQAREAHEVRLAELGAQIEAARRQQEALVDEFLAAFDRLQELDEAAVGEEIAARRAAWVAALAAGVREIGRNPLDGVRVERGDVRRTERPVNSDRRLYLSGMVGSGGALVFIVVSMIVSGVRRQFTGR